MKWDQIEITGNDNTIHKGEQARKFVEANCPNACITNYKKGKMVVTLPDGISAKPEIIRGHLEDILHGKAKGLKVKVGLKPMVVNFPLGRVVPNVVNINLAKLKVQFIHKRDAEDTSPKKFLEDSRVKVNALRQGTTNPLIKFTNKGVADFGAVLPGKYSITFSDLDECKYDWTIDQKIILLEPLSAETVEFQVEPLYQTVQFIAHCLTTIGHQIFVPSDEDKDKLEEVTEPNGKTRTKLKSKLVPVGLFTKGNLNPSVPFEKGVILAKSDGTGTLTFKKKRLPEVGCWEMKDLDKDFLTKNEEAIEIVRKLDKKLPTDPDAYEVKFKTRFSKEEYTADQLTGEWKVKYHGDVDDSKDIEDRVKFVEDTLEKACAQSNHEATVLKVFMIPECFFQGLYGTYISDDAAELVGKLQNIVKDKKWKDWIFSFGTVNRVFLGLQPESVTGGEKNKTIYEMANHAPVIRGGLEDFDFSGDDSTRLIQKLLNSLELAGEDELIKDPRVIELVKKKEEMVKEMDESVKQGKLKDKELENEIKRIMRIRPQSVNEEVQFEATEYDEQVARLLEKLLEDNTINSAGLRGDEKETEIKVEIKKLGIARAVRRIRISKVEDGIFFIWGERLKLYEQKLDAAQELEWEKRLKAAEKFEDKEKLEEQKKIEEEKKAKKPVPLKELRKESMSLEDYVFACPRKAGPLFKTLAKAREVKSCKRLVFGLEICADHGEKRIININKGPNQIDIDIHLVPSAGQKPRNYATRKDGYVFNCDGWNTAPKGGRTIERHLDGPSPFKIGIKPTSPIYPHSAATKRKTDSILVDDNEECLKPEKIKTPSAELSKVIFAYGPGEIHFYPLQDLPK